MNKKAFTALIAVTLVIVAACIYALALPQDTPANDTSAPKPSQAKKQLSSENSPQTAQPSPQPGSYQAYSADAITATKGTKVLFFHAPWCPQCQKLESSIRAQGVPAGVTVFKVDYDSNQPLRQKYGVTIQTTFVKIDDAGNKLGSYVAYDEPQFSSVEQKLLQQ